MLRLFMVLIIFSTPALSASEFVFKDPEYSFQALRAVAATTGGAADIGECLVTAKSINEGDDEGWFKAWNALAERLEGEAKNYSDTESARSTYRRASNYFRTAEFFLHTNPKDPRILQTWRKSKNCFLEAIKGLKVEAIRIPFENTTLPAYLCTPENGDKKCPLLLLQSGFDGTAEELYFVIGEEAVKRGYLCLIFEGPGQGAVIREQNLPFRPNWESVITPVVDYALSLPQVDSNKIVLMGLSFGGYLVPRALAFEKRIQLAVVNGGVYDFHEVCMQQGPKDLEQQLDDPQASKEIDVYIAKEMQSNPTLRWVFGNGMYTFQAKTPSEWLRMTRPYTLENVIQKISTPMLVVDSDQDHAMPRQSRKFYDALPSRKDFMLFTAKEGAGEHCQVGAYSLSNERIFNWIEKKL